MNDFVGEPLIDATTYAILASLAMPRSERDICDATGISRMTVHRRVTALVETDLVASWQAVNSETGRSARVYQRTRDSVEIEFEPPSVEGRVERAERLNL